MKKNVNRRKNEVEIDFEIPNVIIVTMHDKIPNTNKVMDDDDDIKIHKFRFWQHLLSF